MRRLSIRWRLTLWYGAVLLLILIGSSGAVYLLMQRHLLTLNDSALWEELDELTDEIEELNHLHACPKCFNCGFLDMKVTSYKFARSRANRFSGAWVSSPRDYQARLTRDLESRGLSMRAWPSTSTRRFALQAAWLTALLVRS